MSAPEEKEPINLLESNTTGRRHIILPHELTAEWTVKAHLKFAKAGETVRKEINSDDTVRPVRVMYKWSTLDDSNKNNQSNSDDDKVHQSCSKDAWRSESFRSPTSSMPCEDMGVADTVLSSSNKRQRDNLNEKIKDSNMNFYGTRCHSTCNIIVTAIADFLPPPPEGSTETQENLDNVPMSFPEKDFETFVFKTNANYITQPENKEAPHASSSSTDKVINLRDAICQTSDTETKYSDDLDRKRCPLERRDSRRLYDYRKSRSEDALKQLENRGRADGGNCLKSSYTTPSITKTNKTSCRSKAEGDKGASGKVQQPSLDSQKKPRTVHIDVYCTGSEDDDQADVESSSYSDDDNKKADQESNSTFQTVLENDQMHLRHYRIKGASLPRRLAEQKNTADDLKNIGHALTKSSTTEEVNESKQLLFRKHIGDQRAAKLQNIRQKYLRQLSDDTLSLEYPNSSRSTVRDNTCSSISSAFVESSWKESDDIEETSYSLAKSDSFEYENALDRLRIRQMEHLWSRSCSKDDEIDSPSALYANPSNKNLQTILELSSSKRESSCSSEVPRDVWAGKLETQTDTNLSELDENLTGPPNYKFQQISHFPRNTPGFLQFFGPHPDEHNSPQTKNFALPQSQLESSVYKDSSYLYPMDKANLQRWKSETRENLSSPSTPVLTSAEISRHSSPQSHLGRCSSEAPLSSIDINTFTINPPTHPRRFDMFHRSGTSESQPSSLEPRFGYSSEYLHKAKVFGDVVSARKPGHHVGPTKNPNCSCECCQRWLSERFQTRDRLFSIGELPVLKKPF